MKGKRAKSKGDLIEVEHKVKDRTPNYAVKDRVIVKLSPTEEYKGKIIAILDPKRVKVRLDPEGDQEKGDKLTVPPEKLRYQPCSVSGCKNRATKRDGWCEDCRADFEKGEEITERTPWGDKALVDSEGGQTDEEVSKKGGREQIGFNQYGIKWDDSKVNFKFETSEGVKFYGWWRKTRQRNSDTTAYCVDMYAERNKEEYAVESLYYLNHDPRENMKSLNADICAAGNKWFFQRLNGTAESLDDLTRRAKTPTLRINRLETIDRILIKLREYRDTSIKAGGERLVQITGNRPSDPKVNIILNLTSQSFILKGKVPPLETGALYDTALDGGKGGERARAIKHVPSAENVDALVAKLKSTTDKGEQRRIRGLLRKMGHRGGARSRAKAAAQEKSAK